MIIPVFAIVCIAINRFETHSPLIIAQPASRRSSRPGLYASKSDCTAIPATIAARSLTDHEKCVGALFLLSSPLIFSSPDFFHHSHRNGVGLIGPGLANIRRHGSHLLVVQLFLPAGHRASSIPAVKNGGDHVGRVPCNKTIIVQNGFTIHDAFAVRAVTSNAVDCINLPALLERRVGLGGTPYEGKTYKQQI